MFSLNNCGLPENLSAVSVIRDESKTYAGGWRISDFCAYKS